MEKGPFFEKFIDQTFFFFAYHPNERVRKKYPVY